jgi:hypothetical protein
VWNNIVIKINMSNDNCTDSNDNIIDGVDNAGNASNTQELIKQLKDREMRLWFNKMMDDIIGQKLLQNTNTDIIKEQIVNHIMSTIPKTQQISITTTDGIVYAPIELAIHSPVIKEYLECERDTIQTFKVNVTSEALNILLAILFDRPSLEKYKINDNLNQELLYLIEYLMIGQLGIIDNVTMYIQEDDYYKNNNSVKFTYLSFIFYINNTRYDLKFYPHKFCKKNQDPRFADNATTFRFEYCVEGYSNEEYYISEKSFNESATIADTKFDQSFKTLITHENNKSKFISETIKCLDFDKCSSVEVHKYFACLIHNLHKYVYCFEY